MNKTGDLKEEGFTLIEIITVCMILATLSAIALPFFMGQRRDAIEATLVSDVRNAAMEMEKQAIFSATGYAPELPETFFESDGNVVVIDATRSNEKAYCIMGSNPDYGDMFIYYHSDSRKVTHDMSTCGFIPVKSFSSYPDSAYIKAPAPAGYDDPDLKKFKICHANGKALELPLPAIIEGHSNHHETQLQGQQDAHYVDIIPLIPKQYPGQNWTMAAASVWENNCATMDKSNYMAK
jgi:prepilin-type N-terminal cleavage/methylation domain-containing protein